MKTRPKQYNYVFCSVFLTEVHGPKRPVNSTCIKILLLHSQEVIYIHSNEPVQYYTDGNKYHNMLTVLISLHDVH